MKIKPKSIFTVKERLKIWREVRKRVREIIDNDDEFAGICCVLDKVIGSSNNDSKRPYTDMLEVRYPELYKRRPKTASLGSYWWSRNREGMLSRLEVCNEIVRQLEYKK